jgi:hypothetical protein
MNWKNIVIAVLSAIITLLGGAQYQQSNALMDAKDSIRELQQSVNIIANRDSE